MKITKVEKQDELYKRAREFFGMSASELGKAMYGILEMWGNHEISTSRLCEEFMVQLHKAHEKNKWMMF